MSLSPPVVFGRERTYDERVTKSPSHNRLQNVPGMIPGISAQTNEEEKNMPDNKNTKIVREDQIARIYEKAPVLDIFARFTPEYAKTFEDQEKRWKEYRKALNEDPTFFPELPKEATADEWEELGIRVHDAAGNIFPTIAGEIRNGKLPKVEALRGSRMAIEDEEEQQEMREVLHPGE